MTQTELLAGQLDASRQWTLMLVADIKGEDWTYQPGPGLAHALWLCGHVASAQNTLIHVRCLSATTLDDSFKAHFALGKPVASAEEHAYPAAEIVRATMDEVHRKTLSAIQSMSDAMLDEPAFAADGGPHPHYSDKRGAVAHCNRHEAFHAGQLATIRRLLGTPFLR